MSKCFVPEFIMVNGQQFNWEDHLSCRREYRLAKYADQLDLMDPTRLRAAKMQWPVEVHRPDCTCHPDEPPPGDYRSPAKVRMNER